MKNLFRLLFWCGHCHSNSMDTRVKYSLEVKESQTLVYTPHQLCVCTVILLENEGKADSLQLSSLECN